MRFLFFAIISSHLISCNSESSRIDFHGFAETDTIFHYQDLDCWFVAVGLAKKNETGVVDSFQLIITDNLSEYISIIPESDFSGDSVDFAIRGSNPEIDSLPETFFDSVRHIRFYGRLEVYENNAESRIYHDTITLNFVNPLNHSRMVGQLIDGKREGRWYEYYDQEHQQLARSSSFKNGFRQGADSVFRDGKLYILSHWSNGKKHGSYESYWPNGVIQHRIDFENGYPTTLLRYYSSRGEQSDSISLNAL